MIFSHKERNMKQREEKIAEHMKEVLTLIGEDPEREGLKETPLRIAKMFTEIYAGYITPCPVLKTFASDNDEMVVKTNITAFSCCEHHMVPMKLKVSFAYIPEKKVVGISKIIRLIKWCSARLTLQEELVSAIVDEFMRQVNPKGCMCVIEGHHLCEEMRGVRTENLTKTSARRGIFKQADVKMEALMLMKHEDV
jgi:GTP cyclohydrolase IA